MGLFDGFGAHSALAALLDRERQLILAGDILAVRDLGPEKLRLMRRVARMPVRRGQLDDLRASAERNNRLLRASERGFRAVEARLKAMQDAKNVLTTYGRDGQRADLGSGSGGYNKRA